MLLFNANPGSQRHITWIDCSIDDIYIYIYIYIYILFEQLFFIKVIIWQCLRKSLNNNKKIKGVTDAVTYLIDVNKYIYFICTSKKIYIL
jgi:hypothetical protein